MIRTVNEVFDDIDNDQSPKRPFT